MSLEINNAEELAAAREAVEKLRSKKIRHIGRFARRMDFPCEQTTRERALSDGWRAVSESRSLVNALANLPEGYPTAVASDPISFNRGAETQIAGAVDDKKIILDSDPRYTIAVTPEIARAVATVIQWLGTNVGFAYLCDWLKAAGYTVTKDGRGVSA